MKIAGYGTISVQFNFKLTKKSNISRKNVSSIFKKMNIHVDHIGPLAIACYYNPLDLKKVNLFQQLLLEKERVKRAI